MNLISKRATQKTIIDVDVQKVVEKVQTEDAILKEGLCAEHNSEKPVQQDEPL